MKYLYLISIYSLFNFYAHAQNYKLDSLKNFIAQTSNDSIKLNSLILLMKETRAIDPERSVEIGVEAEQLAIELDDLDLIAKIQKEIGISSYFSSNYVDALQYWQNALESFRKINDLKGEANILSNMGAIYQERGDDIKALDLYLKALEMAEALKDTLRIATVLQNIGAMYHNKDNTDEEAALEYYDEALALFEAINYTDGIALTLLHMGGIYSRQDRLDLALSYYKRSLAYFESSVYRSSALLSIGSLYLRLNETEKAEIFIDSSYRYAEKLGDKLAMARALNTKAEVYKELGNSEKAIQLYIQAERVGLEISAATYSLNPSYKGLIGLYEEDKNYEKAFYYQTKLSEHKDSTSNLELERRIAKKMFQFNMDKQQADFSLLQKDNELQKKDNEKQRLLKKGFIGGFIVVFLSASVFLFQRNRIRYGKKLSDKLLLNILPAEVAEELKNKGESDAKDFENVTVLFTDFIQFTKAAEKLSAKALVAEINVCFKAFDAIIQNYRIEKIKTIGDAYMAAGGLHFPRTSEPRDVVKAGIEMQAFMTNRAAESKAASLPYFEMRLGIHTGPVVAGIVGVKKFQYDIWGDTVNTASRMESNSGVGKVNISQTTYNLIKNESGFQFENRGKIDVKGKGEMEMWFVEDKIKNQEL